MSSIIITLKRNTLTTQDYYSLILIVWYIKLKLKMFMEILVKTRNFLFSNYSAKSKYYDDSNELVVG